VGVKGDVWVNDVPQAQVGDSQGAPNVVGHKRGECERDGV